MTSDTNNSLAGRQRLHPEVEQVLALFEELKVPDFYKTSPAEARALFKSLRPDEDALPKIHRRDEVAIDVDGARIAARVYRPSDEKSLPVLLWFHGGGWVFGDLEAGELACREIAAAAHCVVVNVDYRLAPESRFPTALEDCVGATRWVIENADDLAIDGTRVAVGGDSAGGNLAAGVALFGRDNDWPIVYQLLVYPVTQPDFNTPSYQQNAEGFFLSRASMQWFWDHYVPNVDQRQDPRVAPLFANVRDLASAWVMTCAFDPLWDDGRRYADLLEQAGVAVQRYHRDDAIHGVFGMAIGPGAESRAMAGRSLRAAFGN